MKATAAERDAIYQWQRRKAPPATQGAETTRATTTPDDHLPTIQGGQRPQAYGEPADKTGAGPRPPTVTPCRLHPSTAPSIAASAWDVGPTRTAYIAVRSGPTATVYSGCANEQFFIINSPTTPLVLNYRIENFIESNSSHTKRVRYRCRNRIPGHHRNRDRRSINRRIDNDLSNSKYITNLSTKTLNTTQMKVLNLGMTFLPGKSYNKDAMKMSVARFQRSNRMKHFFRNQPQNEPHRFRAKKHLDATQRSGRHGKVPNRTRHRDHEQTTIHSQPKC